MRYHFVGISGSGMRGLADIVRLQGNEVAGSDLGTTGHAAGNIQGADCVVYSPAVREGSPGWVEVVAARKQGIETVRVDELLERLTGHAATLIAIAGTHGKSTTTAMIGQILEAADADPTVYIGAPVLAWDGRSYRAGDPSVWVVEADEYERKFLRLAPTVAVITNIEFEHPDIYADLADVEAAFVAFIRAIRPGGTLVACAESDILDRVIAVAGRTDITVVRYGDGADPYRPDILPPLAVIGRHNILNALAALAAAEAAGVPSDTALRSLAAFRGAGRRLERVGERHGVTVIDDYGHHPTELAVSIGAVRAAFPGRRLVVAFQPHQHARLQALFDDFARSFADADLTLITDVYAVPGRDEAVRVDPRTLADAVVAQGIDCRFVGSLDDLRRSLDTLLVPGDVFLTIGATAITTVGRDWVAAGQ